jgi:hypothetical protein
MLAATQSAFKNMPALIEICGTKQYLHSSPSIRRLPCLGSLDEFLHQHDLGRFRNAA